MTILHRSWRRCALAVVAGLALTSVAEAQTPAPIFTKNAALRLPIQLDDAGRAEIASVKLFVKGPAGRWECAQTAPSTQPSFDFRAPADGEYGFTFVTVDRRGGTVPASVETVPPHRVVIVDTLAPEVSAQPVPIRGERHLQALIRDNNVDWKSVQVSVQTGAGQWVPLQVLSPETPNVFRVPNPAVFESRIRIAAADKAGNATIREIDLGDPTLPLGLPARNQVVQGGAPKNDAVDLTIPGLANDGKIAPPTLPLPPSLPGTSSQVKLPDLPPSRDPIQPILPASFNKTTEMKIPDLPPIEGPKVPMVPQPGQSKDANKEPNKLPLPIIRNPSDYAPDLKLAGDLQIPPVAPPVAPPSLPMPNLPVPTPGRTDSLKVSDPPKDIVSGPEPKPLPEQLSTAKAGATHPVLNTTTCTINYQLDAQGRMPQRIDFWASNDNGRSWIMLRDENGGVAPAKLTLPGDGIYSIRIRPGAGNKPPEPGEDPDCVIEVDTRKPDVSLLQPTLGTGGDEGTMLLTWTAADKNLLNNSVSLFYSAKPEGPWDVIVTGYKNDGAYRWAIPAGLSNAVYLRLEATDRAGNVGRHDLPQPIPLDNGKQRVKVLGIGPAK